MLIGFALVILLGALLLTLPISSRSGQWTNPLDALFTATSATCVTGLIVVDTYLHWSVFGQIVILLLIQTGGLGFMTLATMFSFFFRRTISLSERLTMMQSLGVDEMAGVVRLTKHILVGTLIFEGTGAVILSIRFASDFGWKDGIFKGIFHSISAFCNAGFDLMGQRSAFSSLTAYSGDIVVNVVIMLLIIIGGLGFIVWEDVYHQRSFKKLRVYSKLVLVFTAVLVVGGALLLAVFEWNNPAIMDSLDGKGKGLAFLFQSVTTRTAGFNTIEQSAMTSPSVLLSMILMFIGGSSGSTAGGVKTVTMGVVLLAVFYVARGRRNIEVLGRRVSYDDVLRAVAVVVIAIVLVVTSIFVISMVEPFSLRDIAYECVSAFATVGISMGITPQLTALSKLILIFLMFAGRLGILTITFTIAMKLAKRRDDVRYPETKLMIG
ncbi:TrkH family potassium uptake protein [Feifania hominis]|uniref:Trk family potassium uptake protein n=1 Tax=Feifania hominis TaxID=2763660 RepID=A0A926DA49_9FIRM|nr:TrkH family potassium uptake protein [Feifania hominis]MBC8535210.1 Trk family potassium uptake protein [Feifania hominis]